MSATVPAEIFKAYDIRGLYGEQIDGDIAERIGRAFALRALANWQASRSSSCASVSATTCACPRRSSRRATREGLLGAGANVIDAGQVGSEMLYFLVGSRELDGGLMCTASHNPKAYTGAKLVREGAIALSGDSGIQDVRRRVEAELAGDAAPAAPARARHARGDRHLRRVPARRARLHRPRRGRLDVDR